MKNTKTDWIIIGSSGAAIDGRTIEADWLISMAENYDPDVYPAMIWKEHNRFDWWTGERADNLGIVLELKTEKNKAGGTNLLAILAPNKEYIEENERGQLLHSSMEITTDFPEKGHYYLSGLGATDSPASARTSEIRFTSGAGVTIYNDSVELRLSGKSKAGGLRNFFRKKRQSEEFDMPGIDELKKVLEPIGKRLDDIEAKFAKEPPAGGDKETPVTDADKAKFEALENENKALKAKVDALEKKVSEGEEFKKDLKALREEFNNALNTEHPGTTKSKPNTGGGEGDGEKDDDYL